EDWLADLDEALSLNPSHISCYGLMYESNTPMTARMKAGQIQPVDQDVDAAMYEATIDRLSAAGSEHYAISNWARAGAGCAAIIVIPCYNEADRLDTQTFYEFACAQPDIRFLFVNDGSTDGTESMLRSLAARNAESLHVCSLAQNAGKAEAVRHGLIEACQR